MMGNGTIFIARFLDVRVNLGGYFKLSVGNGPSANVVHTSALSQQSDK